MTKKELIMNALTPFLKREIPFGYEEGTGCVYYTKNSEGNIIQCSVGRYMERPSDYLSDTSSILVIGLDCLKPEVRDLLSIDEWRWIQQIHDRIALINRNETTLCPSPIRALDSLEIISGLDLSDLRQTIENFEYDKIS